MDKIMISVKLTQPLHLQGEDLPSRSSLVAVNVDPSDSGNDLRRTVARLSGHQPGDIRLIFAGKLISDACTLKELEITDNTVIHAVATLERSPVSNSGSGGNGTSSQVVDSPGSVTDNDAMKSSFYVYCKNPCQSVQPGKLRVCCRQCNQDAFTVSRDPSCWDDVLIPGRIPGRCHISQCEGEQAKFYFKCASHSAVDGEHVIPLPLLRTNTRQVECLTCGDVMSPIIVFECPASHVVCRDCFTQYCQLCLNERRFIHDPDLGYTLPCPAKCEDSLIRETHHFLVMGKEQYTRYKRFGAEEYLLQEGGVLCPSPGCGAGILPHASERRVICEREGGFGCGLVFCKNCHEGYHEGECGQRKEEPGGQRSEVEAVSEERERQARWEREESRRTIERTSKPCPKCRVPTERDGGCMHMTCSRAQCGFEWCWLCSVQWNSTCLQDHWFGADPLL